MYGIELYIAQILLRRSGFPRLRWPNRRYWFFCALTKSTANCNTSSKENSSVPGIHSLDTKTRPLIFIRYISLHLSKVIFCPLPFLPIYRF